ncbi:MAG: hypothetical protein ACC726_08120 [Chloroflexota bacterium]
MRTSEAIGTPTQVLSPNESLEANPLRLASPLDCQPWQAIDQPSRDGVAATIECTDVNGPVDQLKLATFSGADHLRERWLAEMDALDPPLEREAAACEGSVTGKRKWGFGNVACHVAADGASIHWTDGRNRMYGVIEAADDDIARLYEWWRTNARSLGRTVERAPDATPDPVVRTKTPPLRRDPGAPRAIVCDNLEEPIRDPWNRKWRVKKVNFFTRNRYERVVIHLERSGVVRNAKPTMIDIERIPASKLRQTVPQAPRPTKGRTSLVIDMQGVRDAPNLRAYRPSGMAIVKELSILRDQGSRTAVITVSGDGCYEVRVPIWSPSASGDETTAQIYIDFRR